MREPSVRLAAGWAGEQGLIDKLDFSKIPNAALQPAEYKTPYSVAYEFYSSVLAYNKSKLGNNPPQSWADFWDVQKFPGRRALRKPSTRHPRARLMADGVSLHKLYPLDVERALRTLEDQAAHHRLVDVRRPVGAASPRQRGRHDHGVERPGERGRRAGRRRRLHG